MQEQQDLLPSASPALPPASAPSPSPKETSSFSFRPPSLPFHSSAVSTSIQPTNLQNTMSVAVQSHSIVSLPHSLGPSIMDSPAIDHEYNVLPKDHDWEARKDEIIHMYRDREYPLKEVLKHIQNTYNWKVTARMFKTRFEKWGIRKYQRHIPRRPRNPRRRRFHGSPTPDSSVTLSPLPNLSSHGLPASSLASSVHHHGHNHQLDSRMAPSVPGSSPQYYAHASHITMPTPSPTARSPYFNPPGQPSYSFPMLGSSGQSHLASVSSIASYHQSSLPAVPRSQMSSYYPATTTATPDYHHVPEAEAYHHSHHSHQQPRQYQPLAPNTFSMGSPASAITATPRTEEPPRVTGNHRDSECQGQCFQSITTAAGQLLSQIPTGLGTVTQYSAMRARLVPMDEFLAVLAQCGSDVNAVRTRVTDALHTLFKVWVPEMFAGFIGMLRTTQSREALKMALWCLETQTVEFFGPGHALARMAICMYNSVQITTAESPAGSIDDSVVEKVGQLIYNRFRSDSPATLRLFIDCQAQWAVNSQGNMVRTTDIFQEVVARLDSPAIATDMTSYMPMAQYHDHVDPAVSRAIIELALGIAEQHMKSPLPAEHTTSILDQAMSHINKYSALSPHDPLVINPAHAADIQAIYGLNERLRWLLPPDSR